MATKNLIPRASGEGEIGLSNRKWNKANFVSGSFDELLVNGQAVTGGSGSASNSFETISVAGQSNVVADSSTDTLTLVAGSNITLTTDASTDSITIAAAGGGASALNDLSDATISTASGGQLLVHNGSGAFVNVSLSGDATLASDGALTIAASSVENSMLAGSISASKLTGAIFADLEDLGAPTLDGQFIVATGAGAFAYESGTTVRTSLGLGNGSDVTFNSLFLAGQTSNISMGSYNITNLADPTSSDHAATKAYVDGVAQGLDIKSSVRAATTAALNLNDLDTGYVIDTNVTLAEGDRVLVKDQTTASENGIYQIRADGVAPIRTDDMAEGSQAAGVFVFVEEGSTNADKGFVCTSNDSADTVGTHDLAFSQFSSAGEITAGTGLTKTGNTINLDDTAVSPGSYGSGTAVPVITVDQQGRITAASTTAISGGGSSTLSGLSDTTITSPSAGHVLVYDGTDSFDNVAMSGDARLASDGALSLYVTAITGQSTLNIISNDNYFILGKNSQGLTRASFLTLKNDLSDYLFANAVLGADLDVATYEVKTTAENGNVTLLSNGTGVVEIKGNTDSSGTNPGAIKLNCEQNSHGITIKSPAHASAATYTLTLPTSDGNPNEFLQTDGSGVLTWAAAGGGSSYTTSFKDNTAAATWYTDNITSAQTINDNGTDNEVYYILTPTTNNAITLPTPSTSGQKLNIKNMASGFSITISAASGDSLDGSNANTHVLSTQYENITLVSAGDSTNWYRV